jgi:hypothetical protein
VLMLPGGVRQLAELAFGPSLPLPRPWRRAAAAPAVPAREVEHA